MSSEEFVFVYIPCASKAEASKIGKILVENKTVACANILPPMQSIYAWNGGIEEEEEVLLIMKTKKTLFDSLKEEVEKLHSYTTPCIICLPIKMGNSKYFQWLGNSTR